MVCRIGFFLLFAGCTEQATDEPRIYVSDYRANAIVRYGIDGTLIDVFAAGDEQRLDRPASVRRGPDGQLYSAGFGRGDINRYDVAGNMTDVFYWDTRLLEEPVELEFRGEQLFVLGNDTKNLIEIDRAGRFVRELGWPTMRGAQDFVIDGDLVYVATEQNPTLGHALQVWSLATGELVRSFATLDEVAFASGLALDGDTLLVSDLERGTITRFDPTTGNSLGVIGTGLVAPVEIDLGPDGAIYALDLLGLHRVDAAGRSTIIEMGGPLERPLGFTFDTE